MTQQMSENEKKEIASYLELDLDTLKWEIAQKCIDTTGTMDGVKVLVRVIRGKKNGNLTIEYHRNGTDGYKNYERFWYEFNTQYFGDMPSGENVFPTEDGEYEVTDENDTVIGKCTRETLMEWLTYDLTELNYDQFNEDWEEFLSDLYHWTKEGEVD